MIKRIVMGFGAALSVALLAAPSEAAISWNLKPTGTGNWDWTLTGVYQWYNETSDGTPPLPWASYYGFMWANAADHCIEISTRPGRWTSNPDTRICVTNQSSGPYQSVNDDFGGTLQSKARFWIRFPVINGYPTFGEYRIKIAPFTSAHSSQDFELVTTRRDLSEAACTTNQTTIPWVKIIGNGTAQTTLVFSPNAS
jgi:hypothetical protein